MDNKLSILDLAAILADSYGMDAKTSQTFVKTVFEIVEEFIAKDKLVEIKGFGTFKLINVSDRESVNVNTGERIVIAGHSKLTFTPDSALKDAVNRPFADFETTTLNEGTSIEEMERLPMPNSTISEPNQTEEPQPLDDVLDNPLLDIQEESADYTEDSLQNDDTTVNSDEIAIPITEEVDNNSTESVVMEVDKPTTLESNVTKKDEPVSYVNLQDKDNSAYPMSSETEIAPSAPSKRRFSSILYVLITIILMVLSYICGHYQVFNMLDFSISDDASTEEPPLVEVQNQEPEKEINLIDTIPSDTILLDSLQSSSLDNSQLASAPDEDYEEIAKYFPQVPNGDYLIIGDAGKVHHMQVGETLYRIARKELGSQDLIHYLIIFNNFEDPNIIHTGDPIRIPKLIHKVTKEILPKQ
jgi:nucleoid DNA-binding protein/LysM repeat protein